MKNQKRTKSSISINLLPDEVLMEILKRVSVTDLLKYCRVCQKWRDLISSKNFKDMHLRSSNSPPMVLLSIKSELVLLQNIWDTTRKRLTILRFNTSYLPFSGSLIFTYQGLMIFYNNYRFCRDLTIFNPVYGDKLIVSLPSGFRCTIFGMFFNKWIKKYCILYRSIEEIGFHFKMLVIGVQQSWKDLKPPKLSVSMPEFPPVVIDDAYLYWLLLPRDNTSNYISCEEVIMAFDTKKEEFSLMSHPSSTKPCRGYKHTDMHIVKIDGYLSFVQLKYRQETYIIKIWSMKDFESKLWVKTHNVSFSKIWDVFADVQCMSVEAVENGEVLLKFWERGCHILVACNLKNGTARKIGSKYYRYDKFYMYVPSFASLPK